MQYVSTECIVNALRQVRFCAFLLILRWNLFACACHAHSVILCSRRSFACFWICCCRRRRRLRGECANFCVRRITLYLPRLQNLKAALFSSRSKVRESHASTCFFLIFSSFFLHFFSSVFFAGSLLFKFLLFLFFFWSGFGSSQFVS